jgi:hypothetical protein
MAEEAKKEEPEGKEQKADKVPEKAEKAPEKAATEPKKAAGGPKKAEKRAESAEKAPAEGAEGREVVDPASLMPASSHDTSGPIPYIIFVLLSFAAILWIIFFYRG